MIHYLTKKAASSPSPVSIVTEIDLYKFDPWELPGKANFGEHEWYFFSPRDRKYPNGARPNRAAGSGYWKATGTDKPIMTAGGTQKVGVKKALVFYKGRPPKGIKTNWIMHEYRLPDSGTKPASFSARKSLRLDDWVLCRIYKKSTHTPKVGGRDRENSSGVEEVLASLPEVHDPKLNFLPRLGSFGALCDSDSFLESVLTEPGAPLSAATLQQQMELSMSPPSIRGGAFFPADSSSTTRYSFPGIVPKSEAAEMDHRKLDPNFSRGSAEYSGDDEYFSHRNLFSLANLAQRNLFQHPKIQTAMGGMETPYKWPFADKSRF